MALVTNHVMNNVDYRKKQTELGESYSASTELIAN